MSTKPTSILRALVATATALLLAVALTACGSDSSDQASDNPTAAGSTSPGVSTSGDDDGSGSSDGDDNGDSDSDKGTFQLRPGLPKGYPADEVPLVKGKVLQGMSGAFAPSGKQVEGWTIRVQTKQSVQKTVSGVGKALAGQGFHGKPDNSRKPVVGTYKNEDYTVHTTVAGLKNGSLVIYSVIDR